MSISTLSSSYQICNRVLSAALTATESWRGANGWEEGVNHEKGWNLHPGVELSLLCEEIWNSDSHSGHGKPPAGTAQLWLTAETSFKVGFLFLWSHELFLEVGHLRKKRSLSLGSKECVILKPNPSSVGLGLFCVWHSEHCPSLYVSPSWGSDVRWASETLKSQSRTVSIQFYYLFHINEASG